MKKLLLIPALIGSLSFAQDYKYEITPVIGYNIAEGNLRLDNQFLYGAEIQYNTDKCISPELTILYTDADYESSSKSTDIYRIMLNGVHEYDKVGFFKPLVKAGIGYETIDDRYFENRDSVFFDAGVGAKIPFTKSIALKAEALYMLKNNENRWDNNLALLVGINFAFGQKAQKAPAPVDGDDDNDGVLNSKDECPNTKAGLVVNSSGCFVDGDDDNDGVPNSKDKCPLTRPGVKVNADGCFIDGDDDNDGVPNSKDKCPNTPAGKTVNAQGCFIDGDDDKDGVLNSVDQCPTTPYGQAVDARGCAVDGDDDNDGVPNSIDKCPTTPAGTLVDADGCTKVVNLSINFKTGSYSVTDSASKQNIQKFADFLRDRPEFNAQIIGHTDSVGKKSNNQKLSENRANTVRDMIIQAGNLDSSRVSAIGMGEDSPKASNKTADGRAENRRIEASLHRN